MEATLKPRGGKRANSGRKPITDRKKQVTIYARESEIKVLGGMEEAKDLCYNAISRKVKLLKR